MPRWKLMVGHYLNVPGTEWEYKEITDKGRTLKKIYPVPLYMNPEDPGDHNWPGEIIVAQEPGADPRDYIFTGPPTPDMLPLDEAAQLLSDRESPKWINPIDGAAKRDDLGDAIRDIAAIAGSSRPGGMVPREEFDELKAQLAEVVAMNKALVSKERRV
jgi:hypothetical protein